MPHGERSRPALDRPQPRGDGDGEVVTIHAEYARNRDPQVKEQLLANYAGLARALARRFAPRGTAVDDLNQVVSLGLLKAIERFDPERGSKFSSFAVPIILGELKRHMRDESWQIRPPRRLHDLYMAVQGAVDELTQTLQPLQRVPTIRGTRT